jgi:hypothetical protein
MPGAQFKDGKNPGTISGFQDAACTSVNLDSLNTELATVIDTCVTKIADQLVSLAGAMTTFIQQLRDLTKSGHQIANNLISDVLQLLSGLVVPVLQAIDTVIETIFSLLPVLLDAMVWMISRPINIPVLSTYWTALTSEPLSLLNVLTLIVAIPSSVTSNAASSLSTSRNAGALGADINALSWAWFYFASLSCVADATCDASSLDGDSPLAIIDWGASLVSFVLGTYNGISKFAGSDVMYILELIGIGISAVSTVLFSQQKGITRPPTQADSAITERYDGFSKVVPALNWLYGTLMLELTTFLTIDYPDQMLGPHNFTLGSNLCSSFTYMMKVLLMANNPYANLGVAATDFVLPTTSNFLSMAVLGDL